MCVQMCIKTCAWPHIEKDLLLIITSLQYTTCTCFETFFFYSEEASGDTRTYVRILYVYVYMYTNIRKEIINFLLLNVNVFFFCWFLLMISSVRFLRLFWTPETDKIL